MSRIEWEYDLVERPFCEQLKTMGWAWIEGSLDDPQATERSSFREVILHNRLTRALQQINLRRGKPWLDESRIIQLIEPGSDLCIMSKFLYKCSKSGLMDVLESPF